ncbi:MAG TPA: Hpt domain-containing protein [Thermoanaerobaculia bacterium]|jgi:chemotaxis protein histidine kinase CheA
MITPEYLKTRFLSGLERRTMELYSLIDVGDEDGIYRAFHSLAGIGGTYGFHEVTRLAREGEEHSATGDRAAMRRIVERITAAALS